MQTCCISRPLIYMLSKQYAIEFFPRNIHVELIVRSHTVQKRINFIPEHFIETLSQPNSSESFQLPSPDQQQGISSGRLCIRANSCRLQPLDT